MRARPLRRLDRIRGAVAVAVSAGAVAGIAAAWRRRRAGDATAGRATHVRTRRFHRNADLARLGTSVGAAYATTAARKVFASAERRIELDREREL
ncbi:MAG: hypothetical protein ACKOYG_11585, partial [Ilumatobacteraceae bacterium]